MSCRNARANLRDKKRRNSRAASGDWAASGGVHVIDCPYLSSTPGGLRAALTNGDANHRFDAVLFADVCKKGVGSPLDAHACDLHSELGRVLPPL